MLRLTYASRTETIAGSKVLITGFGYCGKALAQRLKALGAEVAVAARSVDDRAYGRMLGLAMLDLTELAQAAAQAELVYHTRCV